MEDEMGFGEIMGSEANVGSVEEEVEEDIGGVVSGIWGWGPRREGAKLEAEAECWFPDLGTGA